MDDKESTGLKASSFAALALAFASFGDAFLYPFLPLNFSMVGIPALWVGLILSINRFVRILSNTLMVYAFSKYGLRPIMLIAVVIAIVSTFGYGLATGIVVWVFLRIMWGLAFSALRIGTLGYALQHQRPAIAFGVSRGLQEAGPMISLFMAPMLLKYFHYSMIFSFLSLISLPALYFAWKLPNTDDKTPAIERRRSLRWPSTLNAVTFVMAVVVDGIIVVVLGILFLHDREHISLITATTLAAAYLGYRRICLVVFSSAAGWFAERFGVERIFNISLALVILGLLTIVYGWVGMGAVILFTFYSINSAITPVLVLRSSNALAVIAENATWRDVGAATGTLLGGVLISSQYLNVVLIIAVLILVSLLMALSATIPKKIKLFYLWR